MKKFLLKINFWLLILVAVAVLLCLLNYSSKTWLIGWDSLSPEFDLPINIFRQFFGVWREEQGLGALAGHSHMADLPRVIFLYFASFIFPANFLRYLYFSLCLILGPLGTYFFVNTILLGGKKNLPNQLISFLGGLFYLLNLGTMQHFYVPFEMFTTLFAFLPWLLLVSLKFLKEGDKKSLVYFCILTVLALPMAYAATLWYVYFAFFLILLISYLIWGKLGKKGFGNLIILSIVTLFINSFWLLPNIYLFLTSAGGVSLAKMNMLFSPKAFAYDSKFATIGNAIFLKGFLFDWLKYKNGGFSYLLGSWFDYLKNKAVLSGGILISLTVLWGVISSIFFDKKRKGLIVLTGFLFSFIFLIHETPALSSIFSYLRNNFDIFKEGLRFPWTKFSIPVIFCYSIFFSLGIEWLFQHWFKEKSSRIFLSLLFTGLLVFWTIPAFKSQLISPELQIKIPDEYFQTFAWFNEQPKNQRIALLPAPTVFGWEYYRWKFEGAGFWWFGLNQPLLDRDFDRWNPQNENFYWEISQAIYSKDISMMETVLEKYQVNWLLLDGNMISPSWPQAIFTEEIENMLLSSKFNLTKSFNKIKIYKVNLDTKTDNFVFLENDLPKVNSYEWDNRDTAYGELGNYLAENKGSETDVYYPFRSLFSGRAANNFDFEIKDLGDKFIFSKTLPKGVENYSLKVAPYNGKEIVQIEENLLSETKYLIPITAIHGNKIEVTIPKAWGIYSAKIDPTKLNIPSQNCNNFSPGKVENSIIEGNLQLFALDANNCSAVFNLGNFSHQYAYLFSVEAKNIKGQTLLFWLENLTNRKADLELYLPKSKDNFYLIQPPMAPDGLGYSLHFDNISIGKETSVNELGNITVNPIPYDFLTQIKLVKSTDDIGQRTVTGINIESIKHPNPSFYEIEINGEVGENDTLVLSQSYHQGWHAYQVKANVKGQMSKVKNFFAPMFGKEIKEHVLVNNWENGWNIDKSKIEDNRLNIAIIFLPQYLEYLGFGLLGVSLIVIILSPKPNKKSSK